MNIFKKLFGSEKVPEKVREQAPAKENSISFSPFVFRSNQHQRYEQGNAAMGEQNSPFKMIERDGLITKGLLIIYSQILTDLRNNLIKI